MQLSIKSEILRAHYNGKYLLQVWEKGGKKLFEKVLKGKVETWCSSDGGTLVYKPSEEDEDSDCIYIVYVYENYIQRIRDPVNDSSYRNIYYSKGAFFIGNHDNIKFWEVPQPQI